MKRYLTLLLLVLPFTCSIYAQEDSEDISQIDITLSAECEPLTSVAGCVNIASGHFFQTENDLVGNTIDPIRLTRYYDSNNKIESFLGYGFGSQFPLLASTIQKGSRHFYAMISQRDGFLIPYRGKLTCNQLHQTKVCQIDPRLLEKGYTNLSIVEISGHANFVNWQAIYKTNFDPSNTSWTVQLGDGTKRSYDLLARISKEDRIKMGAPTQTIYLLTEEEKPNGNKVKFDYQAIEGKPCLSKVRTINRTGNITLNELQMHYLPDSCVAESSCGNKIIYSQKTENSTLQMVRINRKTLTSLHSSQKGSTTYKTCENRVVRVDKPQGHFLEVEYDSENRVKRLQEPLGIHGEPIITYQFQYGKDDTKVWNALQQLTLYRFDRNQRLSQVDYLDRSQIMKQEVFRWSTKPGQEGWLKTKSIRLGEEVFYLKSYDYDHKGNITRETLYGNLTGEKPETFTTKQKDSIDHYTIEYEYSHDELNLLVRKKTPEGWEIFYSYLPGTNLRTKELHTYNGKIQKRVFNFYDDNGQIQTTIEDDGSGQNDSTMADVTFRRVKTIQPVMHSGPSFGKPKRIVESCLNKANGQIVPLKITKFGYDGNGNEVIQKVYDSQHVFCYEITKAYDDRQRLIQKTNALGEVTRYAYDENNNKIEEELIGSGKLTAYVYDLGNRLTRKEERHQNGEVFATTYSYNPLNQLVSEIDSYGQETNYTYDRLGRQIQCVKPLIIDGNRKTIRPTTTKQYNVLDQIIAKTDENGFTTHFSYNAYGDPTQITYPDESVERFVYYPCGWLRQKWAPDGTSVHYTYNPQGHVLKERTLDANGATLKEVEYGYKGSLLQYKKDTMGLVTTYQYDGAGRKIAEVIGDGDQAKVIKYTYDDFGRVIEIFRALNGEDGQHEVYSYDWLDRMIAKTLQDSQGAVYAKETYEYDISGNKTLTSVWHANDKIANYRSSYRSDGNILWKENPLEERTIWLYNNHHMNGLGQCVQCRAIKDPFGRPTREADDTHHRLVRRDVYEKEQQMSCTHYDYDAVGHQMRRHSLVMADGKPLREYAVLWSYNSRGWLSSETEMPEGKTTRYTYDRMGRLVQKEKPDGVSLHYTYDALGRVRKKTSSDGTIGYAYRYDLHDNPIEIRDLVHHIVQKRVYDLWDRLIEEEIGFGIVIRYTYDALDRVTRMTLPDGSYVNYVYDAYHLRKIQRINAASQLDYEYECQSYDMNGNLLKGISPAGATHYTYDLLGRMIGIEAPCWESHLKEFDPVGNLLAMGQKDPNGELNGTFEYDRFNQLASESAVEANQYLYDSIGNCLKKNDQSHEINALNQVVNDGQADYTYDVNGNLIAQSKPRISYEYDALNRLISCKKGRSQTSFIYDAFGRCLQITDEKWTRQLLYQGEKEIGSLFHEFRLVHPEANSEATFAIELEGEVFFPIQDHRYNICVLQRRNGSLAQWYRYSAFGSKAIFGEDEEALCNPWRFANRREVAGLLLFTHRFYNPHLMRWQVTDPLGFEDGLNLYAYNHNNPFSYRDPDGRLAIELPVVMCTFGPLGVVFSFVTAPVIAGTVVGCALAWVVYNADKWYDMEHCNRPLLNENRKQVAEGNQVLARNKGKKKYREENFPGTDKDLENNPDWKETTHPDQREKGSREFENVKTGEKIRFDKGDPTKPGHGGNDHYHRYNPDTTGKEDLYLDKDGKPIPKNHETSHLYPPEGTYWEY